MKNHTLSYDWNDYHLNDQLCEATFKYLSKIELKDQKDVILYLYLASVLGFNKQFTNTYQKLNGKSIRAPYFKAQYHALVGRYFYENYKYDEAIEHYLKALSLIKKNHFNSPAIEFYTNCILASCYSDSGRFYFGMDCYEQILNHSQIPEYAEISSMWGLNYMRIVMGQYDTVRLQLPKLPVEIRDYLELCVEQRVGKTDVMKKLIKNGFSQGYLKDHIGFNLQERLLLSLLVLGTPEDMRDYRASELFKEYMQDSYGNSWSKKMYHMTLALLGLRDKEKTVQLDSNYFVSLDMEENWPPYDKLWFYQKKLITLVTLNLRPPMQTVLKNINELYLQYPLNDPIFPYFHQEWYPKSEWLNFFCNFIGFNHLERKSGPKLHLRFSEVVFENKDKVLTLNYSRKYKSLKALQIISGPPGKKFSKKYLHEQLTSAKYSPELHDNRLHQLYGRIRKELASARLPDIFSFNGEGQMVLNIEIVLHSS